MPFQLLLQDFLSHATHLSSGVCMLEKDGFTSWESIAAPVRVVRSVETRSVRR